MPVLGLVGEWFLAKDISTNFFQKMNAKQKEIKDFEYQKLRAEKELRPVQYDFKQESSAKKNYEYQNRWRQFISTIKIQDR